MQPVGRRCLVRSESSDKGNSSKAEPSDKVRKAVEAMKRDGVDEKVARKVCIRQVYIRHSADEHASGHVGKVSSRV